MSRAVGSLAGYLGGACVGKDRHTLIYVRGPLGGPSLPLERVLSRDARGRLPYARGARPFHDGQPRDAWRLPRDA